MRSILLCSICALAGLLSPARASMLFNQSPNLNQFDMTDDRLADDFTFVSGVVLSGINFWYQANFQTDLSEVAYAIYNNSGGSPGSVVTSGTATPSTSNQTDYFFASFSIPNLALAAGTYWFELHAGSSLSDTNNGLTVWWEASDASNTYIAEYSTSGVPNTPVNVSGFNQYAFELTGTAVPEPSALALIGAGLILLGAGRRRRTRFSRRIQ